ncbi:hypothetical protein AC579_6141 [Pseudocercospora musae]|uniref:DUF3328 domain-containing protein n=1 Tax=Pseudocercospora musae TaxID=113226 RepID=A0A139ILM4_9PEZI|nr:hypothetical protein AC579_6141 [Pseudocercospora musae]
MSSSKMKFKYALVVDEENLESNDWASENGHDFDPRQSYAGTVLSAVFLLVVGLILGVVLDQYTHRPTEAYESKFATEQLLPPSVKDLSIQKFVGGNPFFLSNGTEVIQLDPRKPVYVGSPSPEIDDAWEYLIEARYFEIDASEAKLLWPDTYTNYNLHYPNGTATDSYLGGFDTFHSLHCLNEIRKRLNPEYYPRTPTHGPIHDQHCIDHIRQVLQCLSVASIIPSLYRPTIDIQYSDAAQPHVCRDFNKLHNYTRERYSRRVKPMDWRGGFL